MPSGAQRIEHPHRRTDMLRTGRRSPRCHDSDELSQADQRQRRDLEEQDSESNRNNASEDQHMPIVLHGEARRRRRQSQMSEPQHYRRKEQKPRENAGAGDFVRDRLSIGLSGGKALIVAREWMLSNPMREGRRTARSAHAFGRTGPCGRIDRVGRSIIIRRNGRSDKLPAVPMKTL